jgi:DNA-binding response OmpR family regulator
VNNMGCRVTKTQIFNSVYGLFSEDIDENVIESHISKLRKRLRHRLGYDPIDSQRYLGYRLITSPAPIVQTEATATSLAQGERDLVLHGD